MFPYIPTWLKLHWKWKHLASEHGMPVIPYARKYNLFDAKVLAAHCVHIDEGEMLTLLHHQGWRCSQPIIQSQTGLWFCPGAHRMLELGLNVGIGTDGPASNNDLDMFEEIRLAAFIAKSVSGDPTALPAQTALTMATRLGAKALHLGNLIGSLNRVNAPI